MNEYLLLIKYCIFGFFVTLIISPFVISFIKREKVKQVILTYVESHSVKSGTPTMGGIIFLISILIVSLICFNGESQLSKFSLLIFIAYGMIGFFDDFIKFKFKRNLGLTPLQKIIFQLAIALAIGFYVYYNNLVGSILVIPFSKFSVDVGWFIVPIVAIIYLATTNSVNLTDGLDGLAGYVSLVVIFSLGVMNIVKYNNLVESGVIELAKEYNSMAVICFGVCGALLVFLLFNTNPASIFMGDTGSLALGGFIASVTAFMQEYLILVVIGIMFVVSAVSDILQVFYYKATKKRIFLMAPFHHHLERKGWSEPKIVSLYVFITIIMSAATIIFNL